MTLTRTDGLCPIWVHEAPDVVVLGAGNPPGTRRTYVAVDALLSDEAIECAARALNLDAGHQRGLTFEDDWDSLTEQERGGWRNCARAALTVVTSTGNGGGV